MSRVAPTSGSKTLSFIFIALSALLLYLDITYKSFEGIKNSYKSFAISSSYVLKTISIDPLLNIYNLLIDKSKLIKENKKLKLGICGEHGGDPKSIDFCSMIGLNYVSCSPYRVPIARLAAAQAQLKK